MRVVGRQQYVIASLRDCSDNSRPSTLACSKNPLCVGSEKLENRGESDSPTCSPSYRPSTILRRLAAYSRKNKLYFAFGDLGRVVQTPFLLDYISDIELRRTIQAATNKSQAFNLLVQWAAVGEPLLPENTRGMNSGR